MSVWSNLVKRASDLGSAAKSGIKSLDSAQVKTTSKLFGSTAKAVSGGESISKEAAKKFAKGVGSTAKIGGVVIAGTGITGVGAMGFTKIYDYLGDARAKTEELRRYQMTLDLMDQENEINATARQRELDYASKMVELQSQMGQANQKTANPFSTEGMFPGYEQSMGTGSASAKDESIGTGTKLAVAALVLGLVGAGVYGYKKSKK